MYSRSSRSFRRASLELKPAPPVIIGRANSRLLAMRNTLAGLCKALWNARRAVTMSDQKRRSPKRNNKQQRPAKHRDQHGDYEPDAAQSSAAPKGAAAFATNVGTARAPLMAP